MPSHNIFILAWNSMFFNIPDHPSGEAVPFREITWREQVPPELLKCPIRLCGVTQH